MSATVSSADLSGANALLFKLCCKVAGQRGECVQPLFVRCLQTLSGPSGSAAGRHVSLLSVGHSVERLLSRAGRQRDAVRFSHLLSRLQRCKLQTNLALPVLLLFRLSSLQPDSGSSSLCLPAVSLPAQVAAGPERRGPAAASVPPQEANSRSGVSAGTSGFVSGSLPKHSNATSCVAGGATEELEQELLRELLFAFRGIEGRYLRMDSSQGAITLVDADRLSLSAGAEGLLRRLLELGWLCQRVRMYCRSLLARSGAGLMAHALAAAINQQLDRFYQLVAVMESQLRGGACSGERLTLRRLMVWAFEPFYQLRHLAALVDRCGGRTGGALASALHDSTRHGDPAVLQSVRHLLATACQPMFVLIGGWMLDGVLEDRHDELFIGCDASVADERLWHDKYQLRASQVPSFLSDAQALQILVAGKSVNFLRRVCREDVDAGGICGAGEDALRSQYDACAAEALKSEGGASALGGLIERVYRLTSRRVLDAMWGHFTLMDHLQAVRSFLLLGQGDFIWHLMELIASELGRPASALYLHNLTGVLESAIRATNAQHAPADVLKRLDVRMLSKSPGDLGWDVFSLDYHTDGPIRTVFTPELMTNYLMLFHALWRCKRLEFTLSGIWKNQLTLSRQLRRARLHDVVGPLLHLASTLTAQMVHFIRQLSYYITFEVLECSWAELLLKLRAAESLDEVISAHTAFVHGVTCGTLLDAGSSHLLHKLRTIYNLQLEFEQLQQQMDAMLGQELRLREEYSGQMAARSKAGQFGTSARAELAETTRRRHFVNVLLPTCKSRLETMAMGYQRMVLDFLMTLSSHGDLSLQCLSFRLDFNQHYEVRDPRLSLSLTYHHRRMSSIRI